jgi:methylmalonyl-CoA mutase cobalamin-binding subunit
MIAEYLVWDIMAQLECPTGHAVLPLPVTEFIRVPSTEEIVEAQKFGARIAEAARRLYPHVDFTPSHDVAQTMVSAGRTVCTNALDGLQESGVDIQDPVQILFVLKKLGPRIFEAMFGVGSEDDAYPSGRRPIVPTDIFEMSRSCIERNRALLLKPSTKKALAGRKFLIASTDVHEHAIMIIEKLLSETGAEIVYLGAEQNPDEIVQAACEGNVDTILISTHNGMALDYARRLERELKEKAIAIPVIMGGVLNQKVENHSLPIDVSRQLIQLGFRISPRLGENFTRLIEL